MKVETRKNKNIIKFEDVRPGDIIQISKGDGHYYLVADNGYLVNVVDGVSNETDDMIYNSHMEVIQVQCTLMIE